MGVGVQDNGGDTKKATWKGLFAMLSNLFYPEIDEEAMKNFNEGRIWLKL